MPTLMDLLYAVFIGLVVGIVAMFLVPGGDPGGLILTTLLGVGGAIAANYVGQALHWYKPGEPAGVVATVIGAVILLVLYRLAVGRRPGRA